MASNDTTMGPPPLPSRLVVVAAASPDSPPRPTEQARATQRRLPEIFHTMKPHRAGRAMSLVPTPSPLKTKLGKRHSSVSADEGFQIMALPKYVKKEPGIKQEASDGSLTSSVSRRPRSSASRSPSISIRRRQPSLFRGRSQSRSQTPSAAAAIRSTAALQSPVAPANAGLAASQHPIRQVAPPSRSRSISSTPGMGVLHRRGTTEIRDDETEEFDELSSTTAHVGRQPSTVISSDTDEDEDFSNFQTSQAATQSAGPSNIVPIDDDECPPGILRVRFGRIRIKDVVILESDLIPLKNAAALLRFEKIVVGELRKIINKCNGDR